MSTRIVEARQVVQLLLDDLEGSVSPIEAVLMRAKRLARLMRDTDAQNWLDLETRGYPDDFSFEELGTCLKYAVSGGRLNVSTSKYYKKSLPSLEAAVNSDTAIITSLRSQSNITAHVKNYTETGATERVMATKLALLQEQKNNYVENKRILSSMKAAIHSYVTDTYLAIELGDIAEEIFESARNEVDAFVRAHCPKAAEKLIAISERMAEKSSESRTAALTSCRRLLMTVADSLFPPRDNEQGCLVF
ncbi:AbiTii domain-containing protein [Rhodoblastus sp.]|uniref:AbiTii domain-containing protein n=1 Tax=Rhodoblastus sp. TaxID=1962975 RepID=UPI003F9D0D0F